MKEITGLTVFELSSLLQRGELSAVETAKAYLAQIQRRENVVGAYLTVTEETALLQAERVDALRQKGEALPPLAGVPMALKDNLCTRGIPTTCASRMLEGYTPLYDAFVVEKLQEQQTVLLGKLNMDEFAMGSSNESSSFRVTRNPRDPDRVPGGSSGGSAAAVAAEEAAFSLGSDTGGSLRQPAAFCGVVGLRPTYGAVSRYGMVPFASSLDQIGPLARDIRDCGMVMNAIMGQDKRDATSLPHDCADCNARLEEGVKGVRIALPKELFGEEIVPDVKQVVLRAAGRLEGLGAHVEEVSLPSLAHALPAYCVLSSAEASSNLARFDGIRYGVRTGEEEEDDCIATRTAGFGNEVKRRILLGTLLTSAGQHELYQKALRVRRLVKEDFQRVLRDFDVLLSPVSPNTAHRLGERRRNPAQLYRGDLCTVPASLAGLPALSLPCGEDGEGLPVGLQLMGRAFDEGLLLRCGYALEQSMVGKGEKDCARV